MIMSSREFNQHLNQAQQAAKTAPVIITNRGKPAFVLMSYQEFEKRDPVKKKTIAEMFTSYEYPEVADIELEIPPRSKAQRKPVEF